MGNNAQSEILEFSRYPADEVWDTDLSPDQQKRLGWPDKQRRSITALKRKVAILQQLSTSSPLVVKEFDVPKTRKELRDWYDPARGLWRWEDVKLDNPALKNKEIVAIFLKAVAAIDELRKGKSSTLRRRIADNNSTIERLEFRNAELLEEIGRLHQKIKRLESIKR